MEKIRILIDTTSKFLLDFDWFDEVDNEDNPDSIVLRITLTEGTITDNAEKSGQQQYEIDFINKMVKNRKD